MIKTSPQKISKCLPAQYHFRDVVNDNVFQVGLVDDRQHIVGTLHGQSHKTGVLHNENLVLREFNTQHDFVEAEINT